VARGEWKRTTKIIDAAAKILAAEYPMTLRQCFYRLVSIGVIENTRRDYQALSTYLTKARADGRINYAWITDRSRPEYYVDAFENPAEYADLIKRSYRKDYWHSQPRHIEVWTEKDSIIGSIEPVTNELGVTVRVGRGFLSTTRAYEIAQRFQAISDGDKIIWVFYLGDFDPSGVAIEEDAAARVKAHGAHFLIERLAIHRTDIAKFNLPPLRVKQSDTRSPSFTCKHGDEAVELDALPVTELRERIRQRVTELIDWDLWNRAINTEKAEIASITDFVNLWSNLPSTDDPG
jgi:hypothetical protein